MNLQMFSLSQWQGAAQDMVYMLLQYPAGRPQYLVLAIGSFLACRWAFIRVVHSMNMNDLSMFTYFVITAVGIGSIVLSLAAVKLYKPEWLQPPDGIWLVPCIVIVSSIVLAVPLINTFLRENYFKTLLAWSVSCVTVVGVVIILGVLSDAFFEGAAAFEKGSMHNEETKQLLK